MPLLDGWDAVWVREAAAALKRASEALVPGGWKLSRFRPPSSPRAALGSKLGAALAGALPVNLRSQYDSAAVFDEGVDPAHWARRLSRLFGLVVDPDRVLAALDRQESRAV